MGKLKDFEVSFKDIMEQKIELTKLAKKKATVKKIIDDIENLKYTDSQLEEIPLILISILDEMEEKYKNDEEIQSYFNTNKNFKDFDKIKECLNGLFTKLLNNEYVLATYREDEEKRRKTYKVLLKGFRLIAEILEDADLDNIQMIDILNTIANLNGVCVSGWKEAVVEILTRFEKEALEKIGGKSNKKLKEHEEDPMKRVLRQTFCNARVSVAKELAYKYMDENNIAVSYRPHYMGVIYTYLNKIYNLNLPKMHLSDKLLTFYDKMDIMLEFGIYNLKQRVSMNDRIFDRAVTIFEDELKEEGNMYEILSDWASSYFRRNKLENILTDSVEFLTEYVLNEDMIKMRNIAIKEIMKDYGYISEKKSKGFLNLNRNVIEVHQKRLILALKDIKTANEKESLRQYILDKTTDLERMFGSAVEIGYYDIFDYIKDIQPDRVNSRKLRKIKKNAWFEAIKHGNIDNMKKMLQLGVNINEKDKNKCTGLYVACSCGKYEVVEFLIKNGAQINLECQYRRTPLYIACRKQHHNIIKLLLENNAKIVLGKVSFINDSFAMYKILYMACEKRYIKLIRQLIDCRMNLNMQWCNYTRRTVLHRMVKKGDLEIVNMLINGGASVNTKDDDLLTPLHTACNIGNIDMVKCLLAAKAEVNVFDEELRTPLFFACDSGNLDIVSLLINEKAKINTVDRQGNTPIYIATYNGYLDMVKKLLENGANLKNKYNETILYRACKNGYLDIARILQQRGASANNRISEVLAYNAAVNLKNMEVLNILIDAGVDLNIKDTEGCTALYRVCQQEDIKTLMVLLKKGSKININIKCGRSRKTALDVAYKKGAVYIQEILKHHQMNTRSLIDRNGVHLNVTCSHHL